LRIIAGNLRGKTLYSVRGTDVRPTADRLRESIFNILYGQIHNRTVLDLFSGTGALGIESLSRGADHAVFIDNNTAALSIIKRNIESCALEKQSTVVRWDISKNLHCLASLQKEFDLVLMDPPYNRGLLRPALYHLHLSRLLTAGCRIVVEHSPLETVPEDLTMYTCDDQRKYGHTRVTFLTYQ